jgi:hypothetical protein
MGILGSFLIGGGIFAGIDYLVHTVNDPALAAILALVPISLMASFIIKTRGGLLTYSASLIKVAIITLICIALLFFSVKNTNLNRYLIISLILILWLLLNAVLYYN